MRVLPILFNTEMVRAILDDRKTVTRRVVGAKITDGLPCGWDYNQERIRFECGYGSGKPHYNRYVMPPYLPGDVLYVRETWAEMPYGYVYRADDEEPEGWDCDDRWHPSIHMPKAAARTFLCVTDVRAERLQKGFFEQHSAIFELRAEGIDIGDTCRECISTYGRPCCNDEDAEGGSECGALDDVRDDFARLWDSTLKPLQIETLGWAANPWVFRVEFERCEKPKEFVA